MKPEDYIREINFDKYNGGVLSLNKPGATIRWCFASNEYEIVVPYGKDGKEIILVLSMDDVVWMANKYLEKVGR